MPVTHRFPVPKVKHYGFYYDIFRGFSDIADKKNMPAAQKTKLSKGVASGTATQSGHNNLYCITDGYQEELVVTLYEQLSRTGEIIYLYEDSNEFFDRNSTLLSTLDLSKPHRLFATFTGGNSLQASRAANYVTHRLKDYDFQRVVWNTWSWFPQSFPFCVVKNYIVRLDLMTGDVKSFATNYMQVERYLRGTTFLRDNRYTVRGSQENWLRKWFDEHKEYTAYKSRALQLSQKDPNKYSMKMLSGINDDKTYIIFSFHKELRSLSNEEIIDQESTEFLIMLPGEQTRLPKGDEVEKPPVNKKENPGAFIYDKPQTSQPQRRQLKKTQAPQAQERPIATTSTRTGYWVEESEIFSAQRNLLASYYGKEAEQTLLRIEQITNDLQLGRVPSKSVEHYYVADLPALSRTRGRGAWRLLITRSRNVFNLYAIADYHNGTWTQWS